MKYYYNLVIAQFRMRIADSVRMHIKSEVYCMVTVT